MRNDIYLSIFFFKKKKKIKKKKKKNFISLFLAHLLSNFNNFLK